MNQHRINRQIGFSLPELMVGMVIGLIGIIIIMQVASVFEGQKRTTSGGDDAQNSGAIALFGITRAIKQAGYGFTSPQILGRDLVTPNVRLTPLSPVTVVSAAACTQCNFIKDANTDVLLVIYGNNNTSSDGRLIRNSINPAGYTVTGGAEAAIPAVNTGGTTFKVGDYVIPDNGATDLTATNPHYLYQVSATDPGVVPINNLAYGVPHPVLTNNPKGNHPVLFNLGFTPSILVYAVRNSSLWVCDFMNPGGCVPDPATANSNWVQLAGDVVSMRAECTSAAPAPSFAVRVVLVTRNTQPDPRFTAPPPTWRGQTAINLTATQVPAPFTWQNYRYKTFETIAPIRNVAWSGRGISGCQ